MQPKKTVIINGRTYDAATGLPIEGKSAKEKKVAKPATQAATKASKPAAPKRGGQASTAVHSTTQRSQTLYRRAAKKPAPKKRLQPGRHMDISRSGRITKFAPHPVSPEKKAKDTPDIKPKTHPTVQKAISRSAAAAQPVPTLKQVKEAAISEALAKPAPKEAPTKRWQWSRRYTVISAVFVVLILGAALTYFNLPSLSVGFAASQAGIEATYPEYRPDGYRLDQPVTFSDGEVTLSFASNSGSGSFSITQTRSSWDSSAVLDNVVKQAAGDNYVTTQERGLTIYSYDNTTVWVNGGIMYKIVVTDAPLAGEQIRRIATSL